MHRCREGPTSLQEATEIPAGYFCPQQLAPAPQPGPPQGPGRRDERLRVSVAVCVLSSLCSVGGLLSLRVVTPLTVVETPTPINSSQEPRLALFPNELGSSAGYNSRGGLGPSEAGKGAGEQEAGGSFP